MHKNKLEAGKSFAAKYEIKRLKKFHAVLHTKKKRKFLFQIWKQETLPYRDEGKINVFVAFNLKNVQKKYTNLSLQRVFVAFLTATFFLLKIRERKKAKYGSEISFPLLYTSTLET